MGDRDGYSEDLDQWAMIRWRGAVNAAINGKRGQALLKEMEAALLALPKKELCCGFVDPEKGQVCALGAVALKRKLDKGLEFTAAIDEMAKEFPEGTMANEVNEEFGIAEAMAQEITYINDESRRDDRYKEVLEWVRSKIKKV